MNKMRIIIATLLLIGLCTCMAFGASDVFTAGEQLINDAKSFVVKVSTAVAVIGIGIGAFLLKTSGGNPQKIDMGKKAIIWSIVGWALVNGAALIFSTLAKYWS